MCSSNAVDVAEKLGSADPQIVENDRCDNLKNDDQNDTSQKEPRIQNYTRSFCRKMYIVVREFCFFMLLILTYATFQNNNPKVSNSPVAFPFFPPGSIVKDWYRGQLSDAINLATESDLAFVMYYAPWDAESQTVRHEFDVVSQHMHKYIHFAAINCWQPGSECRAQYSKVYNWPVLMVYPTHGRGIQYKGPRKAEHMIKFLQSVMKPFVRIKNYMEINTYRPLYDAVIFAHVNADLGSNNYGILYTTALRVLERDPLREVQFLVLTGTDHGNISAIEENPILHLVLWNETRLYPTRSEWQPDLLISWIFENLHQVSLWAVPSGTKSQYLSSYIQPGPALILFTPRNPLYDAIDYYTVLHEVATEYYNCGDNVPVLLLKMHFSMIRDAHKQHAKLLEKCSLETKPKYEPTITYDFSHHFLNNTCSVTDVPKKCESSFDFNTNKIYIRTKYLNELNDTEIIEPTHLMDQRSPENLLRIFESERCRHVRLAHKLQPALFVRRPKYFYNDVNTSVTGMGCKTNISLTLIAIDSLQNYNFAKNLGIDLDARKDKTAVVILDPKFETHYIMTKTYNPKNLRIFIQDFTKGNLQRVLISKKENGKIPTNSTSHLILVELTTTTFLPTILRPGDVVLTFYYTTKCAFCTGISHVYLTVAKLLQPITNLKFTRIDGDDNTLPWEYSMHHYPTILLFPSYKKSESRAFPDNTQITVQNLLSFILANLEPEMRLHVIWTLCIQTKHEQDIQLCARTLRLESSLLVGRMLREYRSSTDMTNNTIIFKKLQLMRLLQFLFTSSSKLQTTTIQQYMSKLY